LSRARKKKTPALETDADSRIETGADSRIETGEVSYEWVVKYLCHNSIFLFKIGNNNNNNNNRFCFSASFLGARGSEWVPPKTLSLFQGKSVLFVLGEVPVRGEVPL